MTYNTLLLTATKIQGIRQVLQGEHFDVSCQRTGFRDGSIPILIDVASFRTGDVPFDRALD